MASKLPGRAVLTVLYRLGGMRQIRDVLIPQLKKGMNAIGIKGGVFILVSRFYYLL
jgi:hypothetical protein